jgi:hypothetical protein
MSRLDVKEKTTSPDKFGNIVPKGYEYKKKLITPGKNLLIMGAYLKWYDLYPPGFKFTEKQISETRQFLKKKRNQESLSLKTNWDL